MLEIDRTNDGIERIRLAHGKANVADVELFAALRDAFQDAASGDARAVVLTGTGTIFSAGVDLFRVLKEGVPYLARFLPTFIDGLRTIAECPKPVVAAINGHAIAGGCVLACACDVKLMASGSGRVGLPELRVGVPFPAMALELVRMNVPRRYIQEVVYLGRTYPPEDAQKRGLVDEIVDPETLDERALETARSLAAGSPTTFALTKRQLRLELFERIARTAELDPDVHAQWKTDETRAAMRAYLDQTLGKR